MNVLFLAAVLSATPPQAPLPMQAPPLPDVPEAVKKDHCSCSPDCACGERCECAVKGDCNPHCPCDKKPALPRPGVPRPVLLPAHLPAVPLYRQYIAPPAPSYPAAYYPPAMPVVPQNGGYGPFSRSGARAGRGGSC